MVMFQYTAIEQATGARQHGERAATTARDLRAQLRAAGLQVIQLRARSSRSAWASSAAWHTSIWMPLVDAWSRHRRQRRLVARAEFYDSLATLLDSGIPLLQALETISGSDATRRGDLRRLTMALAEDLSEGAPLADAVRAHPSWFDPTEMAMIAAGQRTGELSATLSTLADRHGRSEQLQQRLMGALTYPAIVSIVAILVCVFLSLKTLPELTGILEAAGVEPPRLTTIVMRAGTLIAYYWWIGLLATAMLSTALMALLARSPATQQRRRQRLAWLPGKRVYRRIKVASVALQLSDLLRTGVPAVEALRVVAPTAGNGVLRDVLLGAADRVERGEDLAQAFTDRSWFDDEFRQLLHVGQETGELGPLLERIGARYQRQARRLIDRLASILEPAVILLLAFGVGIVVLAAVLPLIRLQEVL